LKALHHSLYIFGNRHINCPSLQFDNVIQTKLMQVYVVISQ
jgi:hypothetical protein